MQRYRLQLLAPRSLFRFFPGREDNAPASDTGSSNYWSFSASSASHAPAYRDPPPAPPPHNHHRQLATSIDVFADDFIGAAQGTTARLNRICRILLNAMDQVFRPLSRVIAVFGMNPLLSRKCYKATQIGRLVKPMLAGSSTPFLLCCLLSSPYHPVVCRAWPIFLLRFRCLKSAHQSNGGIKILDELRSMALAIPAPRGLFSHMHKALCQHKDPKGTTHERCPPRATSACSHDDLAHWLTRLMNWCLLVICAIYDLHPSGNREPGFYRIFFTSSRSLWYKMYMNEELLLSLTFSMLLPHPTLMENKQLHS
jgi:hypothetical protein